jgi:hypothetical protein
MQPLLVSLLLLPLAFAATCDQSSYVIEKDGIEYLKLNGTNDLWACSNTNLCAELRTLKSNYEDAQRTIQELQNALETPGKFSLKNKTHFN